MADIDVNPQGGGSKKGAKSESSGGKKGVRKVESDLKSQSSLTQNYAGLAFGIINWSELLRSGSLATEYRDSLFF
ncbi:hypothetical protein, partial [Streptococcus pneumoniae]|uniref:hypothetical protein n=1 Tax=Streptococcus pneumoniae TaxID=1313 RepID=UPI001E42BB27